MYKIINNIMLDYLLKNQYCNTYIVNLKGFTGFICTKNNIQYFFYKVRKNTNIKKLFKNVNEQLVFYKNFNNCIDTQILFYDLKKYNKRYYGKIYKAII